MWKIKRRKAAGRSPANVNCTGFKGEQCRATGTKLLVQSYWYWLLVQSYWCWYWLLVQSSCSWFELSRVKLYKNDLKGNENCFELAGGSSYISRVPVTEGKITVNVWRKSRGNRVWFELARGSSRRGFKLSGVDCITKVWKNRRSANFRARDSKPSLMTDWWQNQLFSGWAKDIGTRH